MLRSAWYTEHGEKLILEWKLSYEVATSYTVRFQNEEYIFISFYILCNRLCGMILSREAGYSAIKLPSRL